MTSRERMFGRWLCINGTLWGNDFFQVRTAGSGVRGWLDASHETNNWLKYVRSTGSPHAVNMRHVLIGGQVMTVNSQKERKEKTLVWTNETRATGRFCQRFNDHGEPFATNVSISMRASIIVLQVGSNLARGVRY